MHIGENIFFDPMPDAYRKKHPKDDENPKPNNILNKKILQQCYLLILNMSKICNKK